MSGIIYVVFVIFVGFGDFYIMVYFLVFFGVLFIFLGYVFFKESIWKESIVVFFFVGVILLGVINVIFLVIYEIKMVFGYFYGVGVFVRFMMFVGIIMYFFL